VAHPFIGFEWGGEEAGEGEQPTAVRFKDSQLEGTSYREVEEGMAPFNMGSRRGVER
jgi:hypothetical protein